MFRITAAGAVVGALTAGAVAAVLPAPSADSPVDVLLTSADTASSGLGDGVALIMGPTGFPTPPDRYAEVVDDLFLKQLGFTGTTQVLTTPEQGDDFVTSEAEGAKILADAVQQQIAGGHVDAANPVVVFGYSQSAAMSTFAMQQLHDAGVPTDDVHFVFVGNTANPNGGLLSALDIPPGTNATIDIPNSITVTLGNPTPDDLYPTDVYTLEYDGFADFPNNPLSGVLLPNLQSSSGYALLNAIMGMLFTHNAYLGLDPQQITDAVPLATAGDGLVNYFMMPSATLPLLEPLLLIPGGFGQALYDLLEPDARILVNLGYGSLTEGWNSGAANVPTPMSFSSGDLNIQDIYQALAAGWQQGVTAYNTDMANIDAGDTAPAPVDNPAFAPLIQSAYNIGLIDTPHPASLDDVISAFLSNLGLNSPAPDAAATVGDLASSAPWGDL